MPLWAVDSSDSGGSLVGSSGECSGSLRALTSAPADDPELESPTLAREGVPLYPDPQLLIKTLAPDDPDSRKPATAEPMPVPPGTPHSFTMVGLAGTGAMGKVVYVKDEHGDRHVLKIGLKSTPQNHVRMKFEADIQTELSNGPAGKYVGKADFISVIGEDGKLTSAVRMDFLPGYLPMHANRGESTTLSQMYDAMSADPHLRREIQRQLHEAIQAIHDAGYVHRDLKPENILVGRDLVGRDAAGKPLVRIIDFGFAAKMVSHGGNGRPVGAKSFEGTGTPVFMGEGQWHNQPAVQAHDVYAMRIIDWVLRRGSKDAHLVRRQQYPQKIDVTQLKLPPMTDPDVLQTPDRIFGEDPTAQGPADPKRRGQFWDASYALDLPKNDAGDAVPLHDRVIAMAEFSRLPQSAKERAAFIDEANALTEATRPAFLQKVGSELQSIDEVKATTTGAQTVRSRAALEILNSTVLIENFDSRTGLHMGASEREMGAVIRGAYLHWLNTRGFQAHPKALGPVGPHPELHFNLFFEKLEALHRSGVIRDPKLYLEEARQLYPKS